MQPVSTCKPPFMDGLRGQLLVNEPMSLHTSWRTGGIADYFYTPADKADALRMLAQLPDDIPLYWIGLGSNLLVRDGGFEGMIVRTSQGLSVANFLPPNRVYAEAGVSCAKVTRIALQNGLCGAEFLASVPGSFGGALAMNAGAFGGEVWDCVEQIECVNRSGAQKTLLASAIKTGYRQANLPASYWILSGHLVLNISTNDQSHGKQKIRKLLEKRKLSQPIQTANAGSVFRNPPNNYAAHLLQQAGLKNVCVGDAVVSDLHANFIINRGAASADDIEQLITIAQKKVLRQTGVGLVPEVRIIGRRL